MRTEQKREPAFTDGDRMPFGKFAGERLDEVPASYLIWLFHELEASGYNRATGSGLRGSTEHIINKLKLANYVWNSQDAIAQEAKERL